MAFFSLAQKRVFLLDTTVILLLNCSAYLTSVKADRSISKSDNFPEKLIQVEKHDANNANVMPIALIANKNICNSYIGIKFVD